MTEPGQFQVEPHAGRFRFSLRALFLFVLVAGLAFSHLVTSWRLKKAQMEAFVAERKLSAANAENEQLRIQLGQLNIADRNRLYAVASPFFGQEDLKWRWQVYVPGSKFRLCAAVSGIPAEGVPTKDVRILVRRLPKGECTVQAAVRRNRLDEWQFEGRCTAPTQNVPTLIVSLSSSIDLTATQVELLDQDGGPPITITANTSVERNEPLVLIRPRVFEEDPEIENSGMPEFCDGIILWIEEE